MTERWKARTCRVVTTHGGRAPADGKGDIVRAGGGRDIVSSGEAENRAERGGVG